MMEARVAKLSSEQWYVPISFLLVFEGVSPHLIFLCDMQNRENRNYSSNMSRSSRCGSSSVFTSSRVLSSGHQYWTLRKLSSSTSLRKC